MNNYENMTKEQLIAEIENLKKTKEEIKRFNEILAFNNRKLNNLLKSIVILLQNANEILRNG